MNYVDLAPIVAIDVMGAPQPLIVRKIAEAANEFFRHTRAYAVDFTVSPLAANTQTVNLSLPAETALCEVDTVRLAATKLFPRKDGALVDEFGEWELATGRPKYYRVTANQLRLVPYPVATENSSLRVRFSVAPTLTAEQMADEPGLRYQDALINGAKALLLAMPKKAWTDLEAAGIHQALYRNRLNEVRILVRNEGASQAQSRVTPRFV